MKKIIAPLIFSCALLASAPVYAGPAQAATEDDAQLNLQPAFDARDELSRASDPGLAYPELGPPPSRAMAPPTPAAACMGNNC